MWVVLYKNIALAEQLGSHSLSEILQTSVTVKISENMVKSGCFEKKFVMESDKIFRDGEVILGLLCKNICILLTY